MPAPLPAATRTLCAELLERLLADAARRTVAKAPGTFVTKRVGGETYAYFQYSEPGGRFRQLYLGKRGPELEGLARRYREEKPREEAERAELEKLCSQVVIGGAWSMGSGPARVLKAFADAGVFETGAVLVGTHAFGLLGNLLGARWAGAHLRTEDLDLAAISLAAASRDETVDAPKALDRLEMGFLPVPALDSRRPSTSFKVRGGALRVDFLAPGSTEARPVKLARLGTYAQPLSYLDYLIEGPERVAAPDAGGFLVLVPSAARFALHKLVIVGERSAVQQAKTDKDIAQAAEILSFLSEARPGDVRLAFEEIKRRRWTARFERGWKAMAKAHPSADAAARRLASD